MSDKLSLFNDVNVSTKEHCTIFTQYAVTHAWPVGTHERTNYSPMKAGIEQAPNKKAGCYGCLHCWRLSAVGQRMLEHSTLTHWAHKSMQGLELVIAKDGLDSGIRRQRCQLLVWVQGMTQRCCMQNDRLCVPRVGCKKWLIRWMFTDVCWDITRWSK